MFKKNYCYSIRVVPIFPFFPSLFSPSPTFTVSPHTIVHVYGSFTHVLWLVPPFSFHHYPSPSSPLDPVSLFHISMPLVLFCSLHSSYKWDHMVFVFHQLVISLGKILSSSIHALEKERSASSMKCFSRSASRKKMHSITLCKYTTDIWSTHLMMSP